MEGHKKHRGGYSNYRKGGRGGGNKGDKGDKDGNNTNGNGASNDDGERSERDRPERRERGGREDRHGQDRPRDNLNDTPPPQRTERGRGRGNRYDRGGRVDRGGGGGGPPRDTNDDSEQRPKSPRRDRYGNKNNNHGSPASNQPTGPTPDYNTAVHTSPPTGKQNTPPHMGGQRSPQTLPPPMPDGSSPGGVPPKAIYNNDPSHVFPSTPYTPAVDHFLNPALRHQVYGSPTKPERDLQSVVVAGAKFQHFINIKTYDERPMDTNLLPEGKKIQVYKCTNRFSEKPVVLRRIVDCAFDVAECAALHERFRHFRHPSLVSLSGVTPTQEFVLGSTDVVMEYRFIKFARSFKELFFAETMSETAPIAESKIWTIACQLTSLIKMFHEVDVPLRGIHWSKMLWVDSTERVLFSGIGLVDVGNPNPNATFKDLARNDLMALGILLLQLAAGSPAAQEDHLQAYLRTPSQRPSYSPELFKLIQRLISPSPLNVNQVAADLGDRLATENGQQAGLTDYFANECAKEVHNGRLMKLMIKLNFVIGSFQDSNDWGNDANERFALRLFHSYLFNQVDDRNQPRVDWFRVYSCLNKLDIGSEELVQLISADGNSTLLVISYADLKQTLEVLFAELQAAQDAALGTPPTVTPGQPATAGGMPR